MILDIQFKIKNNPNYVKYIRENSSWYKILNRNPVMFANFEQEVREKYQLRPSDRISKVLTTLDMLNTLMSTLK